MGSRDPIGEKERPIRVGIFGSALDTGNLGVSALGISTLRGLQSGNRTFECALFDHGAGIRQTQIVSDEWRAAVQLRGITVSRRLYRLGNMQQLNLACRLGLEKVHPTLRYLSSLDAILDIGGGDSFADLYGQTRFDFVMAPKRLAIHLGVPLILLPQTYGPYRDAVNQESARQVISDSKQVWARDPRSFQVLTDVVGDSPDPPEMFQGVDVAFGLPEKRPEDLEVHRIFDRAKARGGAILGVNISGLIFNTPGEDKARFHFKDGYREIVSRLMERLLEAPSATVLLIPHVIAPGTEPESDIAACRAVRDSLDPSQASRVEIIPELPDPMSAKWVIGRCDWFSGMRMHACIAGLSQGVPTVAIAYSDKSLGVFETAGAGDWVVDPRVLAAEEVVDRVVRTIGETAEMKASIEKNAAQIKSQWHVQFEAIRTTIESAASQ